MNEYGVLLTIQINSSKFIEQFQNDIRSAERTPGTTKKKQIRKNKQTEQIKC